MLATPRLEAEGEQVQARLLAGRAAKPGPRRSSFSPLAQTRVACGGPSALEDAVSPVLET